MLLLKLCVEMTDSLLRLKYSKRTAEIENTKADQEWNVTSDFDTQREKN